MRKTSLVTGGAQGIGRAIVEAFVARGDRVFVFDYQQPSQPIDGVMYITVDVASCASIKQGFAALSEHVQSIDILVNNAGVTRDMLALRMSESEWDSVLDVNLKGAFFVPKNRLNAWLGSRLVTW